MTLNHQPGILARVFNMFFSPGRTFAALNAKPDWAVPFAILIVLAAVSSFLISDIAIDDQIARIKSDASIPSGQLEQTLERLEAAKQPPLKYVQPAISAAGFAALFFLVGLVLWGSATVILGEKTEYSKCVRLSKT